RTRSRSSPKGCADDHSGTRILQDTNSQPHPRGRIRFATGSRHLRRVSPWPPPCTNPRPHAFPVSLLRCHDPAPPARAASMGRGPVTPLRYPPPHDTLEEDLPTASRQSKRELPPAQIVSDTPGQRSRPPSAPSIVTSAKRCPPPKHAAPAPPRQEPSAAAPAQS